MKREVFSACMQPLLKRCSKLHFINVRTLITKGFTPRGHLAQKKRLNVYRNWRESVEAIGCNGIRCHKCVTISTLLCVTNSTLPKSQRASRSTTSDLYPSSWKQWLCAGKKTRALKNVQKDVSKVGCAVCEKSWRIFFLCLSSSHPDYPHFIAFHRHILLIQRVMNEIPPEHTGYIAHLCIAAHFFHIFAHSLQMFHKCWQMSAYLRLSEPSQPCISDFSW